MCARLKTRRSFFFDNQNIVVTTNIFTSGLKSDKFLLDYAIPRLE